MFEKLRDLHATCLLQEPPNSKHSAEARMCGDGIRAAEMLLDRLEGDSADDRRRNEDPERDCCSWYEAGLVKVADDVGRRC